ncbi:transposase TnpC protein [Roseibium sp. TrichSKD4]|uniref:IS66 family transposase n=1 Tax=Roseibium sp. TrichSKD4 TaxID=744980 RepID=UPI0001E565F6|nr:IS66 family transposase [Roseibium sp. TrichSKD4]EFO33537.1 transposase TnpC protein [Roseibium sp. TrichSKD4]
MLKDLDITPEDPAELRAVNRLLADEVKALSLKVEQLQHQLHGANRHRFGSKSEGLDQLNLDLLEDAEIVEAAEDQAKQPAPSQEGVDPKPKRKHSRKPLPDHLDREDEELSPGDECGRCGGNLRTLGEDVTEELEYVPGRFKVKRIIRPRKACSWCEAIVQAPLPSRPIERGRPGPGLLAHVLVSKYADHLPLYRLSQIFAREGVDLDRSTMADWVGRSTALLEPLADAIGRMVRQGPALFADDTPIKMLAPGNKKTKTARVWTYVRDERAWSGQSPPCAWYQFTVDRKGEHPVAHLSGYKGWVHADGYSGFNGVFGDDKADEMACMAHVRRKFVDVFSSQGSAIAEEVIRRIAELYAIEKEIRGMPPEDRATIRQARAKPIFDALEEWLQTQLPKISGKSPLAQAIRYALGRMPKARPYLELGHLELDNNTAERAVKPVAIGRKNWMFSGSQGGGKAMAIAYTKRQMK